MVDKSYCMSSYLVYRYIIDDNKDFYKGVRHQIYKHISNDNKILVGDEFEVDYNLKQKFEKIKNKKKGLLLSGGMDSACLASYMRGCDAYTFRFNNGKYQNEELKRAERFASCNEMNLHYVDISWDRVDECLDLLMKKKGSPVHSIEPQVYIASNIAKKDGIEMMIIGDAADYVFGGMDGLHKKDWSFNQFVERYTFLNPFDILINPTDVLEGFEKYRCGEKIDFISFMHEYTDTESYASYSNAFNTAQMDYFDPYESFKMKNPLDLNRIRNGESKYIIRSLFKMKYPGFSVPEKLPMPRLVDDYFKDWTGPQRKEFKSNINMNSYSGNQKWQMYCLERYLSLNED